VSASSVADSGASVSVADFVDRVKAGIGDTGSAHVNLSVTGAMKATGAGDVRYGGAGPEGRFEISVPEMLPGTVTALVVGHAAYVSVPGMTEPGKFFKVDKHMLPMGDLGGVELSPQAVYKAIEAGIVKVDDLGTATVGGDATDHYRVHLDPMKTADELGLGAKLASVPDVPKTVAADLWLDGQDRVRRFSMDAKGTTVQLDLTKWGEPVEVKAPAAKDLVESPQFGMNGQG
jgi:hypothetical protein